MIKNRTFKMILMSILIVLMLAFMAIYPSMSSASAAAVNINDNLFDMQLFNADNAYLKGEEFNVIGIDDSGIVIKYTEPEIAKDCYFYSGGVYLSTGTYTLSLIYNGSELIESVTVQVWGGSVAAATFGIDENKLYSATFDVTEATFYRFNIVLTNSQLIAGEYCYFSFNDIMLSAGEEVLTFAPHITPNDEITAIEEGANGIIAKLDDLFGAESGIIAGASLGTFIMIVIVVLFITKRR